MPVDVESCALGVNHLLLLLGSHGLPQLPVVIDAEITALWSKLVDYSERLDSHL